MPAMNLRQPAEQDKKQPMSQSQNSDLEHVLFDYSRLARTGLPEAVFSERKPLPVLESLMKKFSTGKPPILFTRLWPDTFRSLPSELQAAYNYDPVSGTAFCATMAAHAKGSVAVVSAGSADAQVAMEAMRTLVYLGIKATFFEDCGVAGLWRLVKRLPEINAHAVIIAVAGMEGALGSVLGGLSPRPIFAVPSSVGYGASSGGHAALSGMLASCAPGVAVLNIDNGYGAACAAARVVNGL